MTIHYKSPTTNPLHPDYKPKGNLPVGTSPRIWATRLKAVTNQYTDLHKGEGYHFAECLVLIP